MSENYKKRIADTAPMLTNVKTEYLSFQSDALSHK